MAESPLSEREQELLMLVATGASNKEISQKLYISVNTVKVHLRNIYTKLEVASRTEAAMWAVQNGLVDSGVNGTSTVTVMEGTGLESSRFLTWFNQLAPFKRFGLMVGITLPLVILGFVISYLLRPEPEALTPEVAALVSNLDENRWKPLADMPTARAGLAAVTYDNLIYAIAGEAELGVVGANERYDPQSDTWEILNPKPVPVADVLAGVTGGRIFIPGGRLSDGEITDILEIYDPRMDTWSSGASLPVPLSAYALATFEGKIFLFGGWDGAQTVDSVYVYDPDQDTWIERTPMPTARAFAGAAAAGSKIYVIGGWDGEKALDANETYTPDLDSSDQQAWTIQQPLPESRSGMGVVSVSDLIYVIGGEGGKPDSLFEYQFESDTWSEVVSPYDQQLSKFAITTRGSGIHIMGGYLDQQITLAHHKMDIIYTVVIPVVR